MRCAESGEARPTLLAGRLALGVPAAFDRLESRSHNDGLESPSHKSVCRLLPAVSAKDAAQSAEDRAFALVAATLWSGFVDAAREAAER